MTSDCTRQAMDLIEDTPTPPGNQPEYSVSELANAVKRVIEEELGLVRVRGAAARREQERQWRWGKRSGAWPPWEWERPPL